MDETVPVVALLGDNSARVQLDQSTVFVWRRPSDGAIRVDIDTNTEQAERVSVFVNDHHAISEVVRP